MENVVPVTGFPKKNFWWPSKSVHDPGKSITFGSIRMQRLRRWIYPRFFKIDRSKIGRSDPVGFEKRGSSQSWCW
jgi:hypothetical protein